MKIIPFKRTFLTIMIIAILSFGLTGCDINIVVPENTGTVRVTLTGTFYYDIKIDGVTRLSNKAPGTYTITDVSTGYQTIEAIDVDGKSYGYDSKTIYVSTGTNNVYLDPVPTVSTGTVYVVLSGKHEYDIKMDDSYKFTNVLSGTYTILNVTTGDHFFEAIDIVGESLGYDSKTKYISTGSNYVYLNP